VSSTANIVLCGKYNIALQRCIFMAAPPPGRFWSSGVGKSPAMRRLRNRQRSTAWPILHARRGIASQDSVALWRDFSGLMPYGRACAASKRLFLLAQFLLWRAEKVFAALITLLNIAVVEAGNETS